MGEAPPEVAPLVANEVGSETVWLVAKHQSKYWKSIDVKACEPKEGKTLSCMNGIVNHGLMNLPFKSHIEYPEQTISIPGMF